MDTINQPSRQPLNIDDEETLDELAEELEETPQSTEDIQERITVQTSKELDEIVESSDSTDWRKLLKQGIMVGAGVLIAKLLFDEVKSSVSGIKGLFGKTFNLFSSSAEKGNFSIFETLLKAAGITTGASFLYTTLTGHFGISDIISAFKDGGTWGLAKLLWQTSTKLPRDVLNKCLGFLGIKYPSFLDKFRNNPDSKEDGVETEVIEEVPEGWVPLDEKIRDTKEAIWNFIQLDILPYIQRNYKMIITIGQKFGITPSIISTLRLATSIASLGIGTIFAIIKMCLGLGLKIASPILSGLFIVGILIAGKDNLKELGIKTYKKGKEIFNIYVPDNFEKFGEWVEEVLNKVKRSTEGAIYTKIKENFDTTTPEEFLKKINSENIGTYIRNIPENLEKLWEEIPKKITEFIGINLNDFIYKSNNRGLIWLRDSFKRKYRTNHNQFDELKFIEQLLNNHEEGSLTINRIIVLKNNIADQITIYIEDDYIYWTWKEDDTNKKILCINPNIKDEAKIAELLDFIPDKTNVAQSYGLADSVIDNLQYDFDKVLQDFGKGKLALGFIGGAWQIVDTNTDQIIKLPKNLINLLIKTIEGDITLYDIFNDIGKPLGVIIVAGKLPINKIFLGQKIGSALAHPYATLKAAILHPIQTSTELYSQTASATRDVTHSTISATRQAPGYLRHPRQALQNLDTAIKTGARKLKTAHQGYKKAKQAYDLAIKTRATNLEKAHQGYKKAKIALSNAQKTNKALRSARFLGIASGGLEVIAGTGQIIDGFRNENAGLGQYDIYEGMINTGIGAGTIYAATYTGMAALGAATLPLAVIAETGRFMVSKAFDSARETHLSGEEWYKKYANRPINDLIYELITTTEDYTAGDAYRFRSRKTIAKEKVETREKIYEALVFKYLAPDDNELQHTLMMKFIKKYTSNLFLAQTHQEVYAELKRAKSFAEIIINEAINQKIGAKENEVYALADKFLKDKSFNEMFDKIFEHDDIKKNQIMDIIPTDYLYQFEKMEDIELLYLINKFYSYIENITEDDADSQKIENYAGYLTLYIQTKNIFFELIGGSNKSKEELLNIIDNKAEIIKKEDNAMTYALYELATKMYNYTGPAELEYLQYFFNKEDSPQKGIYWNNDNWYIRVNNSLRFDKKFGKNNNANTVQQMINYIKNNPGSSILSSRHDTWTQMRKTGIDSRLERITNNMFLYLQSGLDKFKTK